jgi:hypothetical protein
MKRLLNNPWFSASLAVCAICLVAWRLWPDIGRFAAGSSPAGPSGAQPSDPAPADPGPTAWSAEALLRDLPAPALTRDPFAPRPGARRTAPIARGPETVESIHVSALWTEHEASLALINDQIRGPGETVGHLRIASVSQDGVWVTHGAARDFIPLGGDFTLRTPAAPPPQPLSLN